MPSEHSPLGGAGDRPAWRDRLADDLGEDPGRFLELPGADRRALDPDSLLAARLRGIDRLEVVRGWQAYERRRAAERGSDPREGIMAALEATEQRIHETGGRRDHQEIADRAERRREALRHVDLDAAEATFVDFDGETYERSSTDVTASSLVPDEPDREAVADGGRADE